MKVKITTLLLSLTCSAQATLIDLTPGGFHMGNAPPSYNDLLTRHAQIAGANINGSNVVWSPFEPFGDDFFSITSSGIDATLSWNLSLIDGYHFTWLLLEGVGGKNSIYKVPASQMTEGTGFATIDELTSIQAIIFYGTNVIPDTGATLLLFGLALLALSWKAVSSSPWSRKATDAGRLQ